MRREAVRSRCKGKERDAETGNDDFGARYYSNRFGRWLSADWSSVPVPVPYANLTNPQTLNLYSMVADDPESFADLDGHDPQQDPSALQKTCDPSIHGCGEQQREDLRNAETAKLANDQKPQPDPAQNTNGAVQFAKDEAVGMAKEVYNTLAGLDNLFYSGVNALLGTNFNVTEAKPATPGENAAMLGTSVALLLIPESKAADAVKLGKSLASEAQVAGKAEKIIAGAGSGTTLRAADRLAASYGGKATEWSKVSSGAYRAADGSVISTHWYERVGSVVKYEIKSIIDSAPWSK